MDDSVQALKFSAKGTKTILESGTKQDLSTGIAFSFKCEMNVISAEGENQHKHIDHQETGTGSSVPDNSESRKRG